MKNFLYILILPLLLILSSCGSAGGVEAGNPPDLPTTRAVTGTLTGPSASIATLTRTIGDDCGADTLIATNSASATTTASIDEDCSFTIDLTIGEAYVLSLLNGDSFVASFIFNNSSQTLSTITMIIAEGTDAINLGNITINGSEATCEFEPSEQNDSDNDGLDDFEDEDDDNDDIPDVDEEDCDLDGYLDDYDDDNTDCSDDSGDDEDGGSSEDGTLAEVLEVNPRNNEIGVSIDEHIEVRFGCNVDATTINNTNFAITAGAENITCTFETDNDEVSCEHDNFENLTTYTVTLSGIECENGDPVTDVTWSFTTEEEDD